MIIIFERQHRNIHSHSLVNCHMHSGCARRPSSGPSGFYPLRPFASRLRRSSSSDDAADSLAPTLHWPTRKAHALLPPPARQAPRCAGLRPGASRHPPPGCLRSAAAARRAPRDEGSVRAGQWVCERLLSWGRGCSAIGSIDTIGVLPIGDIETFDMDTRCRGKWGHQCARGIQALVVGHSRRAQGECCAAGNGRGRCAPRAYRPEAGGFFTAPLRRWRREP